MLLDATKVPDLCRRLTSDKQDGLEKVRGASITLTTAVSLALLHRQQLTVGDDARARLLSQLGLPGVAAAIGLLATSGRPNSADPFVVPSVELYPIRSRADVATEEWTLFYDRFRRSATGRRKSDMFRSVGGVLDEMGDNVPSHAYADAKSPCKAIAGFHVGDGIVSFCVCDAAWVKKMIAARDGNAGTRCERKLVLAESHIDYIVPLAGGGCIDVVNLQILSERGNRCKSTRRWAVTSSVPNYIRRGSA